MHEKLQQKNFMHRFSILIMERIFLTSLCCGPPENNNLLTNADYLIRKLRNLYHEDVYKCHHEGNN